MDLKRYTRQRDHHISYKYCLNVLSYKKEKKFFFIIGDDDETKSVYYKNI